jgi:ATP-binding cassette, subfamily A (ABC1), member 3
LATTLKGNFAPYVVLPLIIVYLRMTYGLLTEKEKKIKEGMKIMGMKDSSFYFSWVIWYLGIYFITSFLVSLILKATVFSQSNFLLILFTH